MKCTGCSSTSRTLELGRSSCISANRTASRRTSSTWRYRASCRTLITDSVVTFRARRIVSRNNVGESGGMKATEEITLVAPCGAHCGDCWAYKLTKDDLSLRARIIAMNIQWSGSPCPGCRPAGGKCQFVDGVCETYACVERHKVIFCFECSDFPCDKLNPAAEMADILPHNVKIFNLCYIKQHGVANWLRNAARIKARYFRGNLRVGRGPQLE